MNAFPALMPMEDNVVDNVGHLVWELEGRTDMPHGISAVRGGKLDKRPLLLFSLNNLVMNSSQNSRCIGFLLDSIPRR